MQGKHYRFEKKKQTETYGLMVVFFEIDNKTKSVVKILKDLGSAEFEVFE